MNTGDGDAEQRTVYTPTDDELAAASDWHGGQASMLYAIASTGALTLSTVRPSVDDDGWRPMTDAEWRADLAWRLWRELRETAEQAEMQGDEDAELLRAWCDKTSALSDRLAEMVEG